MVDDSVVIVTDQAPPLLKIEVIDGGLRLTGEIDASTIDSLSRYLNPLPGVAGDIAIDLSNVGFIDSSGLRSLIDAHQRAAGLGRRVIMTEPSSVVRRLFEISGLSDYLYFA